MTVHTSRRALFGGAGMIAVAAMSKCGSTPAYAATTDAAWDRLYREFHVTAAHAKTAMDTFNEAETRYNLRFSELGERPTPPSSRPLDTSLSLAAIIKQANAPEWDQAWADYERHLAAWEARRAALEAEVIGQAEEAWTSADGTVLAVLAQIRRYPATTMTMLSQKAEVLDSYFAGQLEGHDASSLVADIRRLAREA